MSSLAGVVSKYRYPRKTLVAKSDEVPGYLFK